MSQPIDSASPMSGGLTRRQFVRAVAAAALATTAPAVLTACGSKGSAGTITVGSKDFTEGEIISEIYALALERITGLPVRERLLCLLSLGEEISL